MVTTVVPTHTGADAVQDVVPDATPLSPFDVAHFTKTTPVSSVAVPAMARVAEDVETIVDAGDVIAIAGGVRSATGLTGGVAAGGFGEGAGEGEEGDGAGAGEAGEGLGEDVGGAAAVWLPGAPYSACIPAMSSSVNPNACL